MVVVKNYKDLKKNSLEPAFLAVCFAHLLYSIFFLSQIYRGFHPWRNKPNSKTFDSFLIENLKSIVVNKKCDSRYFLPYSLLVGKWTNDVINVVKICFCFCFLNQKLLVNKFLGH